MRTRLNGRRGYDCLNEATVHTASISKMIHVGIWVDGYEVDDLRADGVVMATPTGSTSYAMSAGGPLLDPRLETLLIVPIAPFKLDVRPLVVPAAAEIEIKLLGGKEAAVVLDGQHEQAMVPGDILLCTASDSPIKLIRLGPDFFYRRVKEKLCGR